MLEEINELELKPLLNEAAVHKNQHTKTVLQCTNNHPPEKETKKIPNHHQKEDNT